LVLSLAVPMLAGTALGVDRFNVVTPQDSKAFTVDKSSIVRLSAIGDTGSTIEAEILSGRPGSTASTTCSLARTARR